MKGEPRRRIIDVFQLPLFLKSTTQIHSFTTINLSLTLLYRRPSHYAIMSLKRKASTLPTSDAKKPKQNGSITSFFGPPKTVSSAQKPTGTDTTSVPSSTAPATPVSKFDKEGWAKKLTDEQRELLKLEIETLHESWLKELKDEITSDGFLELKRFLKREAESGKKVFPPAEDVYSWYPIPVLSHPIQFHTKPLISPFPLPY